HGERRARRQSADGSKHRQRLGNASPGQKTKQRRGLDVARNTGIPAESADGRGESEALSIIAVIERFNPVWIAREEERLGPRIPDRKGKHPAEPVDHVGTISQKKQEQDLGVGRRLKLSSARLQLLA